MNLRFFYEDGVYYAALPNGDLIEVEPTGDLARVLAPLRRVRPEPSRPYCAAKPIYDEASVKRYSERGVSVLTLADLEL